MLQPFGVVVNLIPGIPQKIVKETLQQAVVAKHFQGAHLTRGRKTYAVVLFVFHAGRLLRRQLLEHSGDRRGADAEMLSEGVAGHPLLFGPGQLEDGFQVIVHRFGVRLHACSWRH